MVKGLRPIADKPHEHAGRIAGEPPAPAAAHSHDGMEGARERARRYLPDAVDFLASIAFARDSEAALHTRMLAAKEIVSIAGVIPQATPALPNVSPPQREAAGDGSGDDS